MNDKRHDRRDVELDRFLALARKATPDISGVETKLRDAGDGEDPGDAGTMVRLGVAAGSGLPRADDPPRRVEHIVFAEVSGEYDMLHPAEEDAGQTKPEPAATPGGPMVPSPRILAITRVSKFRSTPEMSGVAFRASARNSWSPGRAVYRSSSPPISRFNVCRARKNADFHPVFAPPRQLRHLPDRPSCPSSYSVITRRSSGLRRDIARSRIMPAVPAGLFSSGRVRDPERPAPPAKCSFPPGAVFAARRSIRAP